MSKTLQEPLHIGKVLVRPGTRKTIDFPVARLYTHTDLKMPICVVHGKKPGPRLFVSAAVHGDEINGVEIIRRLLQVKSLDKIHGTLIAIPIVNVFGFLNCSRYLPDRRDLNRCFPGSKKGSLAARLAKIFMEQIVANSTHGIDLHTGSNHRTNLPQIRACLDDPEVEKLARAFQVPVIMNAKYRAGSLRHSVAKQGFPMLIYEAGEALRFDELSIQTGLKGVLNVMKEIGMLPKRKVKKAPMEPLISENSTWTRAPKSGILYSKKELGEQVSKGDILGSVTDPYGEKEKPVIAANSGVIIGKVNLPLVHKGDALFHIATFDQELSVDNMMEFFDSEYEDEIYNSET